ncbi:DUF2254 domain-containing protein [Catenovulum sp. 2E275]|uniref:DUF2254 domain-containing protein n=1 Tax=Catenovulum sp. 2E275 TaxID=2980497 RepID=UPI0021D23633|nr:DUF2254 domain-containing protein [Catenovulum sp. 2E275]MCU4675659.1 DUF2254 domain-containing protein [Catenovulum sp. 2E275]
MFTPRKLAKHYRELISSIGFLPSLLSVVFLLFAFICIILEYHPVFTKLKEVISFVLIDSPDNARTILSILIGSTISLTVFSFSMVMIVLNQASSALSPRVIPGLITRKSHQIVLGVYLGSIIYSIILLINLKQTNQGVPSLSILFSLLFGLLCLALFVFFIHSISKAIQVDNVLNDLFIHTKNELDNIKQHQQNTDSPDMPDFSQWYGIKSKYAGYYKGVNTNKLCKILEQNNLRLFICVKQGYFTVEGYPFLKSSQDLSTNPELQDEILSCFVFYVEEFISDHYRYGLTQISEIAVKAMSPGINDPGTALKAIDMLSILLIKRLDIKDVNYSFNHAKEKPWLFFHETSLMELLHDNFSPIRYYAKTDAVVMSNLLEAIKNILFVARQNQEAINILCQYLESVVFDIKTHISNPFDLNEIQAMLTEIEEILPKNHPCQLKI